MSEQFPHYPIIKAPRLRRAVEWFAAALFIAFIVLALATREEVALIALGVFCMVAAFAISGIRGAFARRSPWLPVRKAGRVAMFAVGVLSFVLGVVRLLLR